MLPIRYLKFPPTTHVIHYRNGNVVREGPGLSLLYYVPNSTIVAVPLGSADLPFVFDQVTEDFQHVTLQGQITYRVSDSRRLAAALDFSVEAVDRYCSEDPERLRDRLVSLAQVTAQSVVGRMALRTALTGSEAIVSGMTDSLRGSDLVAMLGIDILGVALVAVRPTPEMARALEAVAREALQKASDLAVYERRNAAIEQERVIKENELDTEIAVEQKRRNVREAKMAADIAVEEQRVVLLEQRSANDRTEADSRAYALEAQLKPLRETDWMTLVAASGPDSKQMIALGFRELAEKADRIGQLNITPDLLRSLVEG